MTKLTWKLGLAIAAAVVFFAPNAFADNTTSMLLTGAGSNVYDGAVYVGPYYATVGGSANTPVICDDYADESYVPESWTAYVTNETNAGTTTNPLKYGDNQSLYNEMSYLATQLTANQSNTAVADAIQFAIWDLGVENLTGSGITDLPLPGGSTCTTFNMTNTACWMNQAAGYSSTSFSNVTIYSFDTCTTTANSPCSSTNPPQEFLAVSTPEPSAILLLVLGISGLFLLKRRSRTAGALIAA
jgi:hypothetical protein